MVTSDLLTYFLSGSMFEQTFSQMIFLLVKLMQKQATVLDGVFYETGCHWVAI